MALSPGVCRGPYEVIAQIGVGGMAEVYRTTDTNLKRAVPSRVLPASVTSDVERLAVPTRSGSERHPAVKQLHQKYTDEGKLVAGR